MATEFTFPRDPEACDCCPEPCPQCGGVVTVDNDNGTNTCMTCSDAPDILGFPDAVHLEVFRRLADVDLAREVHELQRTWRDVASWHKLQLAQRVQAERQVP